MAFACTICAGDKVDLVVNERQKGMYYKTAGFLYVSPSHTQYLSKQGKMII